MARICHTQDPNAYRVTLQNLSVLRIRMDSLQRFLSQAINTRVLLSQDHMDTVSNEILAAIHQIIINGAALLSYSGASPFSVSSTDVIPDPVPAPKNPRKSGKLKIEVLHEDDDGEDCEIVELDAMELLAEDIHLCEVCGKGFKRDANLRMHMCAHGDRFKIPEPLAKPREGTRRGASRFSCPFDGCNRNKSHKKFRSLKSIFGAKKHFKRSHCPQRYSCDRCQKKRFSVLSDLKSHEKHCGEKPKWKCLCGSTFSRKEKLFGHVARFEGHMPVEEESELPELGADSLNGLPQGFFDGLDGFVSIYN